MWRQEEPAKMISLPRNISLFEKLIGILIEVWIKALCRKYQNKSSQYSMHRLKEFFAKTCNFILFRCLQNQRIEYLSDSSSLSWPIPSLTTMSSALLHFLCIACGWQWITLTQRHAIYCDRQQVFPMSVERCGSSTCHAWWRLYSAVWVCQFYEARYRTQNLPKRIFLGRQPSPIRWTWPGQLAFPLEKVTEAASLEGLEIPHGFRQHLIVLLALQPRRNQVRSEMLSLTWSLESWTTHGLLYRGCSQQPFLGHPGHMA